MSTLARRAGPVAIAAALLITGAIKLWATEAGNVAAGALLGAGLIVLGQAVRDWTRPTEKE